LALLVGKLRVGKFIDPVVGMTATGIPPTVKLITMMSEAMAKIEAFMPALEQSMAKVAQEMERILEEHAIQSQQVTPEQLKTTHGGCHAEGLGAHYQREQATSNSSSCSPRTCGSVSHLQLGRKTATHSGRL
jgi:predicted esterase YcpF (UPF0227 family)